MLRAVAYVRTDSGEGADSSEGQKLAIERWAARERVAITSFRLDLGLDGATPIAERPGLVAAYRAIPNEGARLLVAADQRRFSRDELVARLIERAALAQGAALRLAHAQSPPERTEARRTGAAPASGWTRAAIDLARAHERVVLRERIRATFAAKRARGERVGTVPFGFRLAADGIHIVADDAEQAVVDTVRRLSREGHSQRAIVAELAARGVRGRTGAALGQTQVAKILRSSA